MLLELRRLRKKKGYTQENIAGMLGVSVQTFSLIERGEVPLTYNRAVQIANIFSREGRKITPDKIFLNDISNGFGTPTGTEGR